MPIETPWTTYDYSVDTTYQWLANDAPGPAIGNGTLTCRYRRAGGVIFYVLTLHPGTNTTFGSGNWSFELPIPSRAQAVSVGSAIAFDLSTSARSVGASYAGANVSLATVAVPYLGDPAVIATATSPWTWANPDLLQMSGWIEDFGN